MPLYPTPDSGTVVLWDNLQWETTRDNMWSTAVVNDIPWRFATGKVVPVTLVITMNNFTQEMNIRLDMPSPDGEVTRIYPNQDHVHIIRALRHKYPMITPRKEVLLGRWNRWSWILKSWEPMEKRGGYPIYESDNIFAVTASAE